MFTIKRTLFDYSEKSLIFDNNIKCYNIYINNIYIRKNSFWAN